MNSSGISLNATKTIYMQYIKNIKNFRQLSKARLSLQENTTRQREQARYFTTWGIKHTRCIGLIVNH